VRAILDCADQFLEQLGAKNIERTDKLVQLIACQNGGAHLTIDAIIALVAKLLETNRQQQS
jgi:hypothetical protein